MKEFKMSCEKGKQKSSVVRRTKKNGSWAQNKTYRHSIYDLASDLNELDIDANIPVRPTAVKRSKSFCKEEHVHIDQNDSRQIIKQYVANINDGDDDVKTEYTNNTMGKKDNKTKDENSNLTTDQKDENSNLTIDGSKEEFPLHNAIEERNLKILSIYLVKNNKFNIEQKNNFGQTPLTYAVYLGEVDVVKLLLASGANATSIDNYGVSALRYAVEDGDFEIASLLISHGANAATIQNGF